MVQRLSHQRKESRTAQMVQRKEISGFHHCFPSSYDDGDDGGDHGDRGAF